MYCVCFCTCDSFACFLSSELCHKDIILLKWARFVLAQWVQDQLWADARHGLGDQAADRYARPAAVPVHHQHDRQRHLWAAHWGSRPTWPLEVLLSPLSACERPPFPNINREGRKLVFNAQSTMTNISSSQPWQIYRVKSTGKCSFKRKGGLWWKACLHGKQKFTFVTFR